MPFRKKCIFLLLPASAGFLLFYVIPFFGSLYYAGTKNTFDHSFVFLDNFISSFQNEFFLLALKNTLMFTVIGVGAIMVFSLVISILLVSAGKRYRFLRAAFVLPMLLPTAGVAQIWRSLFNSGNRLVSAQSVLPGLLGEVFNPQILPVYLLYVWKYCGFNIILLVSAISSIEKEVYEAAALDGASGLRLHWRITAPMIRPTLFFAAVLSFVNSFRIFKEIYYLFGDDYPPDPVYFVQYYMNNNFHKLNYQMLSSGAIIFASVIFVMVLFGYRSDAKKQR